MQVRSFLTIDVSSPGFTTDLILEYAEFGRAVAAPGDINGDLCPDVLVSTYYMNDAAGDTPANVFLILLHSNFSVHSHSSLRAHDSSYVGLTATIDAEWGFGGDRLDNPNNNNIYTLAPVLIT